MKPAIFKIGILALCLLASGCHDYLDINQNPNSPTLSTPELVLSNALNASANRLVHQEIGAFWGGHWSPSGSVSGFNPEKSYDITTSFRTGIWSGTYDNLNDYRYIYEQAIASKKKALAGMALVMKAYNFQILVDTYNNVPYADALKGTTVIKPSYDDGKIVYDSLIANLDKAVTLLKEPTSSENASPGVADIYFKGANTMWIKFANTLKLRMLLRISDVADRKSFVTSELLKFGSDPAIFLGSGESVESSPGYLKTTGKMNPFYENYGYTAADARAGNHDFYCYSKFFIDILNDTKDPRLPRLAYLPTAGGTSYIGVPFGEGNDQYLYIKVSGFGPAYIPQDGTVSTSTLYSRKQTVMSAAESFFLQAEAVQRGLMNSSQTAQELYHAGITESFLMLGVPNYVAAAKGYYSQTIENVGFATSTNKLSAIRFQKWIALANYGSYEAWTEWRRTKIPAIPISTKALTSKQPVRLLYPLSEYSSNAENVSKQGAISQFDSKIFWMN